MHNTDNAMTMDWAQLVRAEYLEVPGLELTRDQAQRLWGLERAACDALLTALVESRFLRRTRDHRYLLAAGAV
jgi:DNA-binding IclR family transcriptional regulator